MSLFHELLYNRGPEKVESLMGAQAMMSKPRTFKETIDDQIAYHQAKINDLQAVKDSLTPDVEKFIDALQKIG